MRQTFKTVSIINSHPCFQNMANKFDHTFKLVGDFIPNDKEPSPIASEQGQNYCYKLKDSQKSNELCSLMIDDG